jgi:hypothetical protein
MALALVREGIWGLSLFAVERQRQGVGIGRALLDAAMTHAGGARGAIILSSEDPKAMRLYARAGFALRPSVAIAGVPRSAEHPPGVEESDDVERTAAISRAVRGASHAHDIPEMLAFRSHLLVLGDRGFAVHRDGSPKLLAARDEDAARALLWSCLAAAPAGATVHAGYLTAGQDWAIGVALEAGLALSPEGPVFVRGEVGPLAPYIPSGAFL